MIPIVKICGITDNVDAELAAKSGASILGVVLSDRSPRKGSSELVRELSLNNFNIAAVYTEMRSVKSDATLEQYVQLHFDHGYDEIKFVERNLVKKVISVVFPDRNPHFLKEAEEKLSMGAEIVIIDYGREITEEDIRSLPDFNGKRIGLAGMISEDNLSLVLRVNPFVIDLSRSIEEYPGKKNPEKIRSFMEVFRNETGTV